MTEDGDDVDCPSAVGAADVTSNTAMLRVPRSCLGVPRWVRLYLESDDESSHPVAPSADSAMGAGFPARRDERTFTDRIYARPPPRRSGRSGASTLTLPDPTGDVERAGRTADDFDEARPAPGHRNGDIVGITVRHAATEVLLRVKVAHLARPTSTGPGYRLAILLRTDAAATWVIEDELQGKPTFYTEPGAERLECDGLDRSIDVREGQVRLSIPRSCLVDPQWVRLDVALLTFEAHGVATIDDAEVKGYTSVDDRTYTRRVWKPQEP
jgi:hypothetical protein